MKSSLVIPCYWPDEASVVMTLECLDSLKDDQPDLVIVVDDGSPVKAPKELIEQYAALVTLKENGGFAVAVNAGYDHTPELLPDYEMLITGNNDLTFSKGWLDAIKKPLHEGYGISSIRVSDSDGYETDDKITEDDYFGSLWAKTREVHEKVGNLDKGLGKSTFEDKDYWLRAKEAGFKIAKNHNFVVGHIGRATVKKLYPNGEDFEIGKKNFERKWGRVI